MTISIIIAHYAPDIKYRDVLKKTIESIRNQDYPETVDIAVSDDGSFWSKTLNKSGDELTIYTRNSIENETLLKDLDIDYYLVTPFSKKYKKAMLWNQALNLVSSEDIIFLDDDHAFKRNDSLTLYKKYFQDYEFVVGRIQEANNIYRIFSDPWVQGSNFGLKKKIIKDVGGFGEYTSNWGAGEDVDIFWKVYLKFKKKINRKNAYFAGEIITRDLCKGRWKYCDFDEDQFIQGYLELLGIHPEQNESRNKKTWIKISPKTKLLEIWYKIHRFCLWRIDGIRKRLKTVKNYLSKGILKIR
ncbi:MAG: glycosyltransferase family 2 protein [Pseudomonadota bacterium]